MRENYIQAGKRGVNNRTYIDGDWYNRGIPFNVILSDKVYIDTSYGFAAFNSTQPNGLFIDEASGCYDRASFIVSETGTITIGKFSILNGSTIICKQNIRIDNHCMLAWGSVITDSWLDGASFDINARKKFLHNAAHNPKRSYPFTEVAQPVVIEDNVWVGFDAVILPGVKLNRGCVIGCKTIVSKGFKEIVR